MVFAVVRPGVIWSLGGLHETFTDVHIFIFRCAPIHWLIRLHETSTIVLLLTLRWAPSLGLDPCNYLNPDLDINDVFAWIQLTSLEWSFQCPLFSLSLEFNKNVFKVSLTLFFCFQVKIYNGWKSLTGVESQAVKESFFSSFMSLLDLSDVLTTDRFHDKWIEVCSPPLDWVWIFIQSTINMLINAYKCLN